MFRRFCNYFPTYWSKCLGVCSNFGIDIGIFVISLYWFYFFGYLLIIIWIFMGGVVHRTIYSGILLRADRIRENLDSRMFFTTTNMSTLSELTGISKRRLVYLFSEKKYRVVYDSDFLIFRTSYTYVGKGGGGRKGSGVGGKRKPRVGGRISRSGYDWE